MGFKPTTQQQAIVDEFVTGSDLVVEAAAGSGKTSTLVLVAEAAEHKDLRGVYIAYNKAIADEAKAKFPPNVQCATAHSFAFRAVGKRYSRRLNGPRIKASDQARFLGIWDDLRVGERTLNRYTLTSLVMETVARFCRSADAEITTRHAPYLEGVEKAHQRQLAGYLLPFARKAWKDLQQTDGALRFTHDHYLKIWQLSNPRLDVDFVLFDEAQDANPVIAAIVEAQTCQRVLVGDRAQAIYGWNGAVDAMQHFVASGAKVLRLTQSFRFGPAVADLANRWLEHLGTDLRVEGTPSIESRIDHLGRAEAVLCRTNGGALQVALDSQALGYTVHLVGAQNGLKQFVEGARDLQFKGFSSHPDLQAFASWSEVQQYSRTDDGSDLATVVRIVDTYGVQAILGVLNQSVPEHQADVVVSTAHKSKGREWSTVKIHNDFEQRKTKEGEAIPLTSEDIMLRYVAVTRAKLVLDPGPLA